MPESTNSALVAEDVTQTAWEVPETTLLVEEDPDSPDVIVSTASCEGSPPSDIGGLTG